MQYSAETNGSTNGAAPAANGIEQISAADGLAVMRDMDRSGKFYYMLPDGSERPWVAFIKVTGGDLDCEMFEDKYDAETWLTTGRKPEPKPFIPTFTEPETEKHWTEDLKDDYVAPERPAATEASVRLHDLHTTAKAISDNLVPTFGETLKVYESTALAFGFPPAVDALITKTNLDEQRTAMVLNSFRDAYALAAKWRETAFEINVSDATQTDEIAEAKRLYKIVKDERINVEKKRKQIKDAPLRECQLIDGVANVYKDLLGPIESHLEKNAKFVEHLEAERRAKLAAERLELLAEFEIGPGMFPNLGDMTDEAFQITYAGVREQYNARKLREAEEHRTAEIENERLRAENERLAKERAEAEAREAEQRAIAAEAQRKLDEAEAERQAKIAAEEQAARAKALAPDKEKLIAFADEMAAWKIPAVTSQEAVDILVAFTGNLSRVLEDLRKAANDLVADSDCPF